MVYMFLQLARFVSILSILLTILQECYQGNIEIFSKKLNMYYLLEIDIQHLIVSDKKFHDFVH